MLADVGRRRMRRRRARRSPPRGLRSEDGLELVTVPEHLGDVRGEVQQTRRTAHACFMGEAQAGAATPFV